MFEYKLQDFFEHVKLSSVQYTTFRPDPLSIIEILNKSRKSQDTLWLLPSCVARVVNTNAPVMIPAAF